MGSLLWLARRVRRRGDAGRRTSLMFRTVVTLIFGLGGWCLAALIVLTLVPTLPLSNELLRIIAPGVPIALGLCLAWARRDRDSATRIQGWLAASAGVLLGGWLGFTAASGLPSLIATITGRKPRPDRP